MLELNSIELSDYHNKNIIVNNEPYGHCHIKKFFPEDKISKISKDFFIPEYTPESPDKLFQKTKLSMSDMEKMPNNIKLFINYLNSKDFINVLEQKFNLRGLVADEKLFGGGMHESRKGGYLKIHSDFIYIRKRKLKRRLNLLVYLNEEWNENWGGAIELWDQEMKNNFLKVYPHINNAVIFRTDTESNHGFPDALRCPEKIGRKSIAVYYYTVENSIFKRTKYFYARWKKRPGINEPKFGDNRGILENLKNKFLYRFK